jgi:5-methylthioribose kinase
VDIERPEDLVAWLQSTALIEPAETPSVKVLEGGVSNRTVLVRRSSGEAWVLKQALPKLRVEVDWFCSPHRIHQEALGLRHLTQLAPEGAITPLVFEDPHQHILVMTAVPEPHDNWKSLLLSGTINPDHVRQAALLLATIHRNSHRNAQQLANHFADRGYFESLRIEPFYLFSAEKVPAIANALLQLVRETREVAQALVHGDFSPKNILIHQGKLVLLDHEVIHWGDPMFDIGFFLAHLLSKAHGFPTSRETLCLEATHFWEEYQRVAEPALCQQSDERRAVRHTLGCLLARAVGRSPVDYLGTEARQRQKDMIAPILRCAPSRLRELIEQVREVLNRDGHCRPPDRATPIGPEG